MDLNGFDDLLRNLDRMHDDIDDDVGEIVKKNTIELTEKTVKNARFTKGYATGYTRRNIETNMVDKLHGKTISKSGHSGFLEYGTRYMDAQPFLFPSVNAQRPQFLSDLERLVE